jgi:cyclopropane fatty-acyl-phospholipid synthase-like methyltransferase
MEFFELMDISHQYLEILNPSSQEKLQAVGDVLNLGTESRVIDFGCGKGELLILWAERFNISGTGVDISQQFCEKGRNKVKGRKLDDRIEIVQAVGSEYTSDEKYDAGLCIGASFIWGGFRETVQALKKHVKSSGKLAIGEPYWLKSNVPQEYLNGSAPPGTLYEHEILQIANEEGYDIEYMVRSSLDDWDRYNAGNWRGLVRWVHDNPDHPERQDIIDHLRKNQDDYLRYEREYLGWAIYVLNPIV